MALVSKQAAILVKDAEATAALGDAVSALLSDDAQCQTLAGAIRSLAQNNAAERIVDEVKKLVQ
jgi:UDP-N-acetylglucosamine--N-acetylmuramyl-(pentapeptide) pyrophosphoryl-undecaprenol N-acetylglucosamine transferase